VADQLATCTRGTTGIRRPIVGGGGLASCEKTATPPPASSVEPSRAATAPRRLKGFGVIVAPGGVGIRRRMPGGQEVGTSPAGRTDDLRLRELWRVKRIGRGASTGASIRGVQGHRPGVAALAQRR